MRNGCFVISVESDRSEQNRLQKITYSRQAMQSLRKENRVSLASQHCLGGRDTSNAFFVIVLIFFLSCFELHYESEAKFEN